MYCREQFIKCPPPEYLANPQLLDIDSKVTDGKARKTRRREKYNKKAAIDLDDSSNWVTDEDSDSDEDRCWRRRRRKLCTIKEEIKLSVMREIFESQTDEVKEVIVNLYKLHLKQRKASRAKRLDKPRPSAITKKRFFLSDKTKIKRINQLATTATPGLLQFNRKALARCQRNRRSRGKPHSKKKRKNFPRRRRRAGAKRGNRQFRKRILRSQRLFDKGICLEVHKELLDEVWQAVKDPSITATSFCNNNVHCLSKVHRKQIALYEKIEEDLQRLELARQQRDEAAVERKSKEFEKELQRQGCINKIEARAVAQAERDALRKERREARKQRALEKKVRRESAKAEELHSFTKQKCLN